MNIGTSLGRGMTGRLLKSFTQLITLISINQRARLWRGEEPANLPHLKEFLAPYPADDMI
jgi:hypothetical protein